MLYAIHSIVSILLETKANKKKKLIFGDSSAHNLSIVNDPEVETIASMLEL